MPKSVAAQLESVHPQMLRVGIEHDRKKLADLRSFIGARVERALALAGVSKQDAAFRMGYADQGAVSRWCSGLERPLFDKLFLIDGFPDAWIVALAEQNSRMEVVTEIRVRRTA